ncbi:hypothetical protein GOP47_0018221 [Adiantum capillus-veneris]|uniref:APO domain-containing protein n=1 Tax=Adiantum capillus-veneris TaxID=13818 RepID=A0A9D4UGV5_ADICA|nr:hypothetical protein GOP47_0018221 [Adiantum capillus-veneris]
MLQSRAFVKKAKRGQLVQMLSRIRGMSRNQAGSHRISRMSTMSNSYFNQNVKVPMELPQRKKKPFLTSLKEFNNKKAAKGDESRQPPGNGLLVPEFVPVALDTLKARATLLSGVHRLLKNFTIKACRVCPAVHVGPVGHRIASCMGRNNGVRHGRHDWVTGRIEDVLPRMDAFHLSDRLGKLIMHEDRFIIPKVPAVVELCIQAGVDVAGYPTKRRTKPIMMINEKIIEFDALDEEVLCKQKIAGTERFDDRLLFMEESFDGNKECSLNTETVKTETLAAMAEKTLQAWFTMRSGVKKLMSKYIVYVCGYCPQVHVGPKGPRTSDCRAYKNHQRYGHHFWQEAAIDDLIPLRYVWHLRDRNGPPLASELRVFYGAAPAIVELCVQAGAAVPEEYKPMMRLDVVIPDLREVDMVA